MRVRGAIAIVVLVSALIAGCGGGSASTGAARRGAAGPEEGIAGALGHGVDGCVMEAALGDDVGRRREQLLPRVATLRAGGTATLVDASGTARPLGYS
jgi:hypothetical protein